MKMKLILESFQSRMSEAQWGVQEAYYGSIPGEPETPAGYGGAVDAAKAQQHLSDEIDDLVRLGKLDINDLSVETVRANQEIPWDKFQAIDDEVLGDIIRDYQRKKKFYKENLQAELDEGGLAGHAESPGPEYNIPIPISYGTYNIFQQYWEGQSDPLYAVLSRRGSSTDWVTVDASEEEYNRLKEIANLIPHLSDDPSHKRVAEMTYKRLEEIEPYSDYEQSLKKSFGQEDISENTGGELSLSDQYQGLDQVKYQLGLMLGQMASDPAAAKWTQRLDKILVLMQSLTEGRIVHAGTTKDITDGLNKLAGTIQKLDTSTIQNQQASELRAAWIALDSSMSEVFGDSLENAAVPTLKPLEECGMADEPMPFPGPPPEGAGAIEPAFDDHEGRMAKSQLFKMAKYSTELMNLLGDQDQLPAWVQAKVTKAADYLGAVKNYLEYEHAAPSSPTPMQENKISKRRLLEIIKEELK